jgi:hypothetical protein
MNNETHTQSRSRRAIVYLLGAVSIFNVGMGSVRASDLPLQQEPPHQYSDSQEYYDEQQTPREHYVYRAPAPYYSAPPTSYYYEYAPAPPAVLIEPEPYYLAPRYSYRYPVRGYGHYAARGYGRHDGRWARGYHRW